MNDEKALDILKLSKNEQRVLQAVQEGLGTPLAISRSSGISRTTIYAVLESLKERGLVKSTIQEGRKSWIVAPEQAITEATRHVRQGLFTESPVGHEVGGSMNATDSAVVAYHGARDIKVLLLKMLSEHAQEKLYVLQGDTATIGWDKMFSVEETNALNAIIKKNDIVVEAFLPPGWFEKHFELFGKEWATEFHGRATRANIIPAEYFKHGGQVYVFKDATYFLALHDELVVEIKNPDIQKTILALFEFLQEHSRAIDVNATLRKLAGIGATPGDGMVE